MFDGSIKQINTVDSDNIQVPELLIGNCPPSLQSFTFTQKTKFSSTAGFDIEPHTRIVIPHSILSTKVNLQEGYSQNNSPWCSLEWHNTMWMDEMMEVGGGE